MEKSLILNVISYLGNKSPNRKQIELVESMLFNTSLITRILFDKKLSRREIECLNFAALGYSSLGTAEILNISKKTVEQYRIGIKKKLGCKSIAQAVFLGMKYGYINQQELI